MIPGPFATVAAELTRRGLAPIPLGGADGKVPLVKWGTLKFRYSQITIKKLTIKFPDANVGIICGLSGVTIVDIDAPELVAALVERFGETPLMTNTPSGGVHLWYKSTGEKNQNLRETENLAVDIRGIGGQVVVPPSIRVSGPNAGRTYVFTAGASWDDLCCLPKIRPGALPNTTPTALRAVKEGRRNNTLFKSLLHQVKHCDDFETLLDVAQSISADFDPPLSNAEVQKIALSVWNLEGAGKNWVGTEQKLYVSVSELDALEAQRGAAIGLQLFLKLRRLHGDRAQFAVAAHAMARDGVIPGWGEKMYRTGLAAILNAGLLRQDHRGGRWVGDVSLFSFASSAVPSHSAPRAYNTKKTPSFLVSSSRGDTGERKTPERRAKIAGGAA
jgi:hypothetical protein